MHSAGDNWWMFRHSWVCIALPVLTFLPEAGAQAVRTRAGPVGFFLSLEADKSTIQSPELRSDDRQAGGGVAVRLGWGITRVVSFFAEGTVSALNLPDSQFTKDGIAGSLTGRTLQLDHREVGVRLHFPDLGRSAVPFLEVAYTSRRLTQDSFRGDLGMVRGDAVLTGTGVTLGAGLLYFVVPAWAVGTGVKWTAGAFDSYRLSDAGVGTTSISATSLRGNLGVSWFPSARR